MSVATGENRTDEPDLSELFQGEPDPQQLISELRQRTGVSKVRLSHVPNWLRLEILRRVGNPFGRTDGHQVLLDALNIVLDDSWPAWLDHWGSTNRADGQIDFVVEPYQLTARDLQQIECFAAAVGARASLQDGSWWFPGRTIRCVISQAKPAGAAA